MSNPTANKWKSTNIYGKFAVRDLTNQAGNTVIEVAETDLSGNLLVRGDATFNKNITCNDTATLSSNQLTTKGYVDNAVSTGGGSVLLSSPNAWTNINTFNSYLPTSSLGAGAVVSQEVFLTKGIMDNIYARKASVNNWTNQNTFDSYLPTSSLTPTSASQLTTKTFVDGAISTAISGLSSTYQTISGMSSYLTTATASSTYQTISDMTNYLTTATASSTYQTISGMSSYLTTATAGTTYQTISGMSSYLTTATASSTYSTLTNQVKTNTANAFTSTNTFNSNFPTSTLASSTAITSNSIVNKGKNDTLYGSLSNDNTFTGIQTLNGNTNLYGTTTNITGTTNISGNTSFSGTTNTFLNLQVVDPGAGPAPLILGNGGYITQVGSGANLLNNLTMTGGILTQSGSATANTMVNLQVSTISTIPATLTNTSQNYSSVKMKNYVFHSRTTTTASGITLSTDTYLDDGQYLYIRKVNSGAYTLTLTAGTGTTFLNLSNTSVSTIAITTLVGVSFVYDKTNLRWIQLT